MAYLFNGEHCADERTAGTAILARPFLCSSRFAHLLLFLLLPPSVSHFYQHRQASLYTSATVISRFLPFYSTLRSNFPPFPCSMSDSKSHNQEGESSSHLQILFKDDQPARPKAASKPKKPIPECPPPPPNTPTKSSAWTLLYIWDRGFSKYSPHSIHGTKYPMKPRRR